MDESSRIELHKKDRIYIIMNIQRRKRENRDAPSDWWKEGRGKNETAWDTETETKTDRYRQTDKG